jgi:hypothetical protein
MVDARFFTLKELERIRQSAQLPCWRAKVDGKEETANCILGKLQMYEHDGGFHVETKVTKQWLYFQCEVCKYQWSLWKILRRLEERKLIR